MLRRMLTGAFAALVMVASAHAQDVGAGAGRVEVGVFPGGGMFFTESGKGGESDFLNYALGASFAVNVNRWIGLEAEGGGTVGVRQSFNVGRTAFADHRTPSTLVYAGNVVVHPGGRDRAVVPYLTGGIGGLTFTPWNDAKSVGIASYETFLTANVGAGIKWFSTRHFGIRGDYRFIAVKSRDTAPAFFGSEDRYGHRVQAGLIFTY